MISLFFHDSYKKQSNGSNEFQLIAFLVKSKELHDIKFYLQLSEVCENLNW